MEVQDWTQEVAMRSSKRPKIGDNPVEAVAQPDGSSSIEHDVRPGGAVRSISSIQELPPELLEVVLYKALAQGYTTRDGLAVVCKHWSSVISGSGLFWHSMCLSLSDIKICLAMAHPKRRQMSVRRRLMAWLRERSSLVRDLHLVDCGRMPAELPAMLQAVGSPSLRSLKLDACSGSADKVLRAVAAMRGLRSLAIDHASRLGEAPARYAARLLCTLGGLQHLMLHVPRLEGGLSGVAASLTALQTLHVCTEEDFEFKLDALPKLTALREITLTGAMLGLLPPGCTALTALTALSLSAARCLPAPEDGGGAAAAAAAAGGGGGEGGAVEGGGGQGKGGNTFWDTLRLLPALRSLASRHCDMRGSSVSDGVLTLTTLRSLELASYLLNLPDLPPGALPSLTCLAFEGCHLLQFPPSWCCLPALHTLRFKSSPPDTLPPEISQLTSLRDLTLEGGLARAVPPLCPLTGLTSLRLSRMEFLSSLPSGPYLDSLLRLDLSCNRYMALPRALARCTALQELDLSHNQRLQLDLYAVQELLPALSALRCMHLHKDGTLCEVGAAPWDLRSVQALMALAAERPGLQVCLDAGSCKAAAARAGFYGSAAWAHGAGS